MRLKRGRGRERHCNLRLLTNTSLGLGQEDHYLGFEEVILAEPKELIQLAVDILNHARNDQLVKVTGAYNMSINITQAFQTHWKAWEENPEGA